MPIPASAEVVQDVHESRRRHRCDGLGLAFDAWRFNLRGSNTEPVIRLNVETRGDPALLAVVIPALVLTTLFFVADGIQVVSASANRAAGDVWWPTIMHFAAYSLIMMPLGWWLAHEIGVDGLVWAVIVASLVCVYIVAPLGADRCGELHVSPAKSGAKPGSRNSM